MYIKNIGLIVQGQMWSGPILFGSNILDLDPRYFYNSVLPTLAHLIVQ